ncbi:hypothetical protein ACVR1I_03020 [Streptococcus cameli]
MPAEVIQFFTMLGVGIRVVGILSLGFGLLDLGSAKKNNEGSRQDMAVYAIVFGIIAMLWGPKIMAMVIAGLNGMG